MIVFILFYYWKNVETFLYEVIFFISHVCSHHKAAIGTGLHFPCELSPYFNVCEWALANVVKYILSLKKTFN